MGQSSTKLSLVVCGLDNSGKTTIMNALKPEEHRAQNISATIGYNVETFQKGKVKFTAFDMGGAKKFRDLWSSYYQNVDGIIFVIDSSDALRLCVVKDELEEMLQHADIKSRPVPLLIFANKMDITQLLDLYSAAKTGSRPFNIFASNALKGTGVNEGMEWLQGIMLTQQKSAGGKK
eukprot:gene7596-5357_t